MVCDLCFYKAVVKENKLKTRVSGLLPGLPAHVICKRGLVIFPSQQAGRLPAASLVFPGAGRRGGAGEVGEQPAGRLGGDVAWGLCCQDNSWLGKSNSGFAEMFEMLERGMHGERWPRDR